jgi:carbohydrate binding protein with CBM6 domain/putative Ig domain-containing protein
MKNQLQLLLLAVCCVLLAINANAQSCSPTPVTKTNSTKVYVHYMPWFSGPVNPTATGTGYTWGFHWTSDGSGANPNTFTNVTDYTGATVSVRNVDAHYHPLIGPYDQTDPYVLEYHLLLMKLSGIDGVMIDWYGLAGNGAADAGANQNNTAALISKMGTYGLKYGLVMEDAAWTNPQANGNFAVSNYFTDPNYIKLGDMRGSGAANASAPLCAVFGPQKYKSQGQWNSYLSGNTKAFLPLYGQAAQIGTDAGGTFLWPYPQAGQGIVNGVPAWYNDINSYYNGSYYTGGAPNLHNNYKEGGTTLGDNVVLGSAYQGFFDFYLSNASSTSSDQYGIIPRNYGATGNTLSTTLNLAQANKGEIDGIQIATWNDFSEGTIIEPTVEFGFQSLVTVQQFTGVSYTQTDLQEVYKLFQMRKQYTGNATVESLLDQVACDFASTQVSAAETLLDCVASTGGACGNSPAITSSTSASVIAGTALNYTITATKTPTSYGATGLPSALSINTSTGVISGTVQTPGTYLVTVSATNSSGTGSATLTITVTQPLTEQPYLGTVATIPGTIQVENYDLGGQGLAYNDNDATNNGGQYRLAEGVDVETTTDAGGGYDVGWTNPGEWMQYIVNVTSAGTYTLSARVATGAGWAGKKFHVLLGATNLGTIIIPNTGGWETFQTVNITTPVLSTGQQILRVAEDSGDYNINYLTFTANAAPPTITSSLTATGTTGTAFNYTITASNTPTSYNATGLPAGLSINTSTGVISGTPTSTGTSNITISATNANGTGSSILVLTVNLAPPVISSSSTAGGMVGAAFTYTITASGTPNSYNAVTLPAGLTINTATGVISGIPISAATTVVTLSATNAGGTGTQPLTITISAATTSSPYTGTAINIPGTVQAENFDLGGQGIAYNDNDATNNGLQYRLAEGVDIEATTDTGGGYDVGWTAPGEWMQYTVNVTEAGTYTLQARVASILTGQIFYVTIDGVDISGNMTVPNTGGYQSWQTISVTTPVLTTGLHKMRIVETTGGYNFNYFTFLVSTDQACTGMSNILVAATPIPGNTYQWQVSTNNGAVYTNISNGALYSGVTRDTLTINNAPSTMYGYLYRCSVNGSTAASQVATLKFTDTWTGAVSTAWEIGGNWSCGAVPDANSDVIINSGTAIINSAVTIRTLTLNSGTTHLTVNSGHSLTVTH